MALAPKKSVALQARRQPSAGVMPVSCGSDGSVTASLVSQVPPMVAPVPSVGRADKGAQGTPLEVVEQPAMVAIPLPTTGRTGLPAALAMPKMAGATQPVRTPPTHAEVAATVIGRS